MNLAVSVNGVPEEEGEVSFPCRGSASSPARTINSRRTGTPVRRQGYGLLLRRCSHVALGRMAVALRVDGCKAEPAIHDVNCRYRHRLLRVSNMAHPSGVQKPELG